MRILLAIGLVMALATSAATAQQTQGDSWNQTQSQKSVTPKTLTYAQALSKAKTGDKPLLVLVTADWCAPCRQLKASTLPTLIQRDAFRNFHFTMMDYDKDPKVAAQLIGDRGLPQLIMFEKSNGKWLRRTINGKGDQLGNRTIHSVNSVEEFVAQAGNVRLASNKEENTNKK